MYVKVYSKQELKHNKPRVEFDHSSRNLNKTLLFLGKKRNGKKVSNNP